jgi:Tol biopolymer transport system component
MRRGLLLAASAYLCLLVLFAQEPIRAAGASTSRVSLNSAERQGNWISLSQSVSRRGRYVAFESYATNLVRGDTNAAVDIFVRDQHLGRTSRASVNSAEVEGFGESGGASISADGRYVAFRSEAYNLVKTDTNGIGDVFVRDLTLGRTRRVSVATGGAQANGNSEDPMISPDGRYVAFASSASNLVPEDNNGTEDVFVRDLVDGATTRVSVATDGTEGNGFSGAASISGGGTIIAFTSAATNLVPDDLNGVVDVFVHKMVSGETTLVSVSSSETQGDQLSANGVISANGAYVAFHSPAPNLVTNDTNGTYDVFLRKLSLGTTIRISVSSSGAQAVGGLSTAASISYSGRFVAFHSFAINLVPTDPNGGTDVFVRDWIGHVTKRASVSATGQDFEGACENPSISGTGLFVAFASNAPNLIAGDTNRAPDVFIRGPLSWS